MQLGTYWVDRVLEYKQILKLSIQSIFFFFNYNYYKNSTFIAPHKLLKLIELKNVLAHLSLDFFRQRTEAYYLNKFNVPIGQYILLKVPNPQLNYRYWKSHILFFLTSFHYYRSQITVIIKKSQESRWVKPCIRKTLSNYIHTRGTAPHRLRSSKLLHLYNFVHDFQLQSQWLKILYEDAPICRYVNISLGTLRSM